MVFTDGAANDPGVVLWSSSAWAKAGIPVYAIGIGYVIEDQGLKDIAGDEDRVFRAKDFDSLGETIKSLLPKVCNTAKNFRFGVCLFKYLQFYKLP